MRWVCPLGRRDEQNGIARARKSTLLILLRKVERNDAPRRIVKLVLRSPTDLKGGVPAECVCQVEMAVLAGL